MMHSSDAPPNNIHFDNSNYLLPDGHQQLVDHEQLQTHGSSAPLSSADVSMFHGQAGASGHVVDNQGHPMEPLQHHINWQSLEQHYPFHAEAHSMHSDIYQNRTTLNKGQTTCLTNSVIPYHREKSNPFHRKLNSIFNRRVDIISHQTLDITPHRTRDTSSHLNTDTPI
ncbi:hypothetical protein KEM48_007859 [Puccinia striiformis f. sp. tritici PST-130]|nr:hypothetical protein KEM48_007859 [Puccinia striiformis f. sp. tritici PST-130]